MLKQLSDPKHTVENDHKNKQDCQKSKGKPNSHGYFFLFYLLKLLIKNLVDKWKKKKIKKKQNLPDQMYGICLN